MEWRRGAHTVSDERARIDLDVVHGYLARSYWAEGIPRELVQRALENSLCFGLYEPLPGGSGERQIGFARVISDRATFAYLADVFVLEERRGQGLARFLMECMDAHPELHALRRWLLVTRDAHGLYERLGWRALAEPSRHMERTVKDAYRR